MRALARAGLIPPGAGGASYCVEHNGASGVDRERALVQGRPVEGLGQLRWRRVAVVESYGTLLRECYRARAAST